MSQKIFKATVMHVGWEMDNEAWVEWDAGGDMILYTTSHGSLRNMTDDEIDKKIKETQDSLAGLKKAREMVYG